MNESILAILELSFVTSMTEECLGDPNFPSIQRVTQLVEAICANADDDDVTAEDVMNQLFQKYNIPA